MIKYWLLLLLFAPNLMAEMKRNFYNQNAKIVSSDSCSVAGKYLKADEGMRITLNRVAIQVISPYVLQFKIHIRDFEKDKYFAFAFYSDPTKYPRVKDLGIFDDEVKQGIDGAIILYFKTFDDSTIAPVMYKKGKRTEEEGKEENIFLNDSKAVLDKEGKAVGDTGDVLTALMSTFSGFGVSRVSSDYGHLSPDEDGYYEFTLHLSKDIQFEKWEIVSGFVSIDLLEDKRGYRGAIVFPSIDVTTPCQE